MPKVLIFGSGLAGLSAGIHLLEARKDIAVTIYEMGHYPGGKAKSYRNEKGFNIDHGFHAFFAFYANFRNLLKRAGVKEKGLFVSSRNISYFYEEDSGRVHQVSSPFVNTGDVDGVSFGYPVKESLKIADFGARNYFDIYVYPKIEKWDDICYTAWAIERGFDKNLVEKRWFRFSRDAYFNWPNEVSAYITLKSIRNLRNPKFFYINGNYGENLINPLVNFFKKMGGELIFRKKLVRIEHDGEQITAAIIADPDPSPHDCGKKQWDGNIPVLTGTDVRISDFDYIILTLPIDNFKELVSGDETLEKMYPDVKNLRTVVTMSYQMWTKERVLPEEYWGGINGLNEPMGTVIDYKNIVEVYKNNYEYGSVLEWVGQETGFEDKSDDEIKEIIINGFLKIPGAKDPRKAGIIYDLLKRSRGSHQRFILTEPGINKFRPHVSTPMKNLFLAGDWIRNHVDLPTMEGAVKAGMEASEKILKHFSK
ncbi:MAG: FAD-dependent oxidoreductase [Bacteroidetes bacterium]|nr:FAD-dependent oxidoreductase [Bacteroidota bacterium]